ncbi:MAG: SDR family oxidoreductase [Octadecabacter sp.]|nr:SDR family oxidoreductase [Octadecabacter sp.]
MKMTDVKAVITGAASGLGAATARHFCAQGAQVTILDREDASTMASEIGARCREVDVTNEAQVAAVLDDAAENMGGLNVAINCAGIATAEKTLGRDGPHDLASFRRTVEINLVGSFNIARLAAARMDHGGVIINTASVAAFDGQKGQAAYAASKAGITGLSLPMARDLARQGIRVMAIAPGIFRTPMLEGLGEEVMAELAKDVIHPARLGDPAEYAGLAWFIVECEYLNGTTIRLDGALRMP